MTYTEAALVIVAALFILALLGVRHYFDEAHKMERLWLKALQDVTTARTAWEREFHSRVERDRLRRENEELLELMRRLSGAEEEEEEAA